MRRIAKLQHDGNPDRGRISYYHQSPSPIDYSQTSDMADVMSLGKNSSKAIKLTDSNFVSCYAIGFEVERNEIHERMRRVTNLFKGFEMDMSCGVEAITNILPLLPRSMWRMKVYEMFHECIDIIEECPSNNQCSTHMHISVRGVSPTDLREKMRNYAGILYAIYRHRLANYYCRGDIFMDGSGAGLPASTTKFSICKVDEGSTLLSETIEFRLPSRLTSVADMKNRYALMYELVDAAMNGATWAQTMKAIKPIVLSMMNGNKALADSIMQLAGHMQRMIDTRTINKHVVDWVEGIHTNAEFRGYMSPYYDSELRRMER